MTNTILIDSSLSFLYNTKSKKKTEASTGNSYLDMLKSAMAQETDEDVSTADMTMNEYKKYIGAKMQQLTKHPSRSDSTSMVTISKEGWERMKSDSGYEQWVLDTLQSKLSAPDSWADVGSGSYSEYRFGATKEEFQEDNWGKDYPGDIKSYITSEIFNSKKSFESLWLELAQRRLRTANQHAINNFTGNIARLQQLNLLNSGEKDLNSLQNSAYLLTALNAYMK